jgi:hypothetical protein
MNKRLSEIILNKISHDLVEMEIIPDKHQFWVVGNPNFRWVLKICSDGRVEYNQIYFNHYFSLFGINNKEFSKILLTWIEGWFKIRIINISRRNSELHYYAYHMDKSKLWTQSSRFNFSYDFIKTFLTIKNKKFQVLVKDFTTS